MLAHNLWSVPELEGRKYVVVFLDGQMGTYRVEPGESPFVRPEQWLTTPCIVEEYPGMVLLANQYPMPQIKGPWLVARKGWILQGRAIVVGVLPCRHLVSMTEEQVASLGLVSNGPTRQLVLVGLRAGG